VPVNPEESVAESQAQDLRYPTLPRHSTLPSALGALATLFGRSPVPFGEARVLEIGCGNGGNVLSLAAMAPDARFLGFDVADGPIAEGVSLAGEAGLANVTLRTGDVLNPRVVEGQFDYVIAHGIYSWVDAGVREALLALIGRVLSRDGIAIVSYNVLPGTNNRRTLRTVMLDAAQDARDPERRIELAHETLRTFMPVWSGLGAEGEALIAEAETILKRHPGALLGDELTAVWEPQLISDVVAAASRHRLSYLCDSTPDYSSEAVMPSADFSSLGIGDWLRLEQLNDFAKQRKFRESLFVRGETGWPRINWASVPGLYAQADVTRVGEAGKGPARFRFSDGAVAEVEDPALAAFLQQMAEAYPQAVPLKPLKRRSAETLLQLYFSRQVELFTEPFGFTAEPGKTPEASPLARAQLARGDKVIATLLHRPLDMGDVGASYLIQSLNGSREMAEVAFGLAAFDHSTWEAVMARLPGALGMLARLGLMVR
jgi:SAM-dependent methyltransferase